MSYRSYEELVEREPNPGPSLNSVWEEPSGARRQVVEVREQLNSDPVDPNYRICWLRPMQNPEVGGNWCSMITWLQWVKKSKAVEICGPTND